MKKTLFSVFFLAVFGAYALFQRDNSAGFVAANTPISTQTDNTVANSNATAGGSSQSIAETATTPTPTPSPPLPPQPVVTAPANKRYKDGTFTGVSADAYYGYVQVQITTQSDKIVDVQFLDYPHDRNTSVQINSFATPQLRSEAIQIQSAQVDTVSGATDTSIAFRESLSSALTSAHV